MLKKLVMFAGVALVWLSAGNVSAQEGAVGLEQYVLRAGPIAVDGASNNCSGVSYCGECRSLVVVANSPPALYVVGQDGTLRRKISLEGFDDTEDVVWVRGRRFAVVEERRRNLCLFDVDPSSEQVTYDAAERILVDREPGGNQGIEGITYDAAGGRFFAVKEKEPRRIYMIPENAATGGSEITHPWDAESHALGCRDLSAVYYHPKTGHLLLVSDESKFVVETDLNGREIGRLRLTKGSAGLSEDIPQPEGITMNEDGNLYICSEPAWLYVFSRETAQTSGAGISGDAETQPSTK